MKHTKTVFFAALLTSHAVYAMNQKGPNHANPAGPLFRYLLQSVGIAQLNKTHKNAQTTRALLAYRMTEFMKKHSQCDAYLEPLRDIEQILKQHIAHEQDLLTRHQKWELELQKAIHLQGGDHINIAALQRIVASYKKEEEKRDQ